MASSPENQFIVSLPVQTWQRIVTMFEQSLGLPFAPRECIGLANEITNQCNLQAKQRQEASESRNGESATDPTNRMAKVG